MWLEVAFYCTFQSRNTFWLPELECNIIPYSDEARMKFECLTVRKWVHPVFVKTHGDWVHFSLPLGLFYLPSLFGQGTLHHGCLGERSIGVLPEKQNICKCKITEYEINSFASQVARAAVEWEYRWFDLPWQSWQDSCPCSVWCVPSGMEVPPPPAQSPSPHLTDKPQQTKFEVAAQADRGVQTKTIFCDGKLDFTY